MITCSSTLEIVLGSSLSKSTKAACLRDILSPGQSKLKVINPLRQKTLKPRERIYIPPSTQKSIISHQMGKIMRKHPDSHQLKSQLLGYLSSPLTPVFYPNHHTIPTSNICVLKMDHDASKKRASCFGLAKNGGICVMCFGGNKESTSKLEIASLI